MITEVDTNGSGEIDFEEFVHMGSGRMGSHAQQIAQAAQAELEARPVRNVAVQTKERGMAKLSEVEVFEKEVHSRGKQGDARENVRLRKQIVLVFEEKRAEERRSKAEER